MKNYSMYEPDSPPLVLFKANHIIRRASLVIELCELGNVL
jgi:hypothetical protein